MALGLQICIDNLQELIIPLWIKVTAYTTIKDFKGDSEMNSSIPLKEVFVIDDKNTFIAR